MLIELFNIESKYPIFHLRTLDGWWRQLCREGAEVLQDVLQVVDSDTHLPTQNTGKI